MLRNKNVLLTLVTILALASFGFTSFGAASSVSYATNNVAIQSLPIASSSAITTSSTDCDSTMDKDGMDGCTDDATADGDADESLASVKVTPQLAGVCALFKQPAGTQVVSVDGVYAEIAYPYYKVVLAIPNGGNPTIYVNASNCNVIPAP
ncbi:MAG: hypothetical protein P4L50_23225 [Anaerolineaceae bacterium]|nr:hypothetical protein [Anaerolineaceae bacterium]